METIFKQSYRNSITIGVVGIFFLFIFAGCNNKLMQITSQGKTDYNIIKPAKATDIESKSANVLQNYLQQMSGVRLDIITEKEMTNQRGIYVGKTLFARQHDVDFDTLGADGYAFKTVGNNFIIAGENEKGTLYGVYSLLQELGCRKYSGEATYIPKVDDVTIDVGDRVFIPKIKFRQTTYSDVYNGSIR